MIERFEVANGALHRNGLALAFPKGLIFRALLRAGWRGTDGTLPKRWPATWSRKAPFTCFSRSRVGTARLLDNE
jgi:hypothetical protein